MKKKKVIHITNIIWRSYNTIPDVLSLCKWTHTTLHLHHFTFSSHHSAVLFSATYSDYAYWQIFVSHITHRFCHKGVLQKLPQCSTMRCFSKHIRYAVCTPSQQVDMQTYDIVALKCSGPRMRDKGTVEVCGNAEKWRHRPVLSNRYA